MTQVLRLRDLASLLIKAIVAPGDPLDTQTLGEHTLRSLVELPLDKQERRATMLLGRNVQ